MHVAVGVKATSMLKPFVVIVLTAYAAQLAYFRLPHVIARSGMGAKMNHTFFLLENVFERADGAELFKVLRSEPLKSTTAAYTKARLEHIGERVPISADGKCADARLVPDHSRKHCQFPERLDVAMHHALSGGIDARRDSLNDTAARLTVMQRYFHAGADADANAAADAAHADTLEYMANRPLKGIPAAVQKLFASEKYLEKATKICGTERPILEPMMVSMIAALPGQMVAMHYDVPWFNGASRNDLPAWLLVAMQASGLFAERRIPQVQGVAYLHGWSDKKGKKRGGFFMYPEGTAQDPFIVPAAPNTAVVCDGTTMVHGTETYVPLDPPPPLTKDELHILLYHSDGKDEKGVDHPMWQLMRCVKDCNNIDLRKRRWKRLRWVAEEQLRLTLVWRHHCVRDERERDAIRAMASASHGLHPDERLELGEVLDTLLDELVRRGAVASRPSTPREIAETLIHHFIAYPYNTGGGNSTAWMPYNVCALQAVVPAWLQPLFKYYCVDQAQHKKAKLKVAEKGKTNMPRTKMHSASHV